MVSPMLRQSITVPLTALFILLVGCSSSSPTRFYILHSLTDSTSIKESQPSSRDRCVSIVVGPVTIAEYLERPQIVTRFSPNEVRLAEFDQWAEPLDQNIARVLADNLSALLCTKLVVVFPWKGPVPIEYQVKIEILRLDGNLGGNATLEVQWMIFAVGEEKRLLASKKLSFNGPTDSQDYQALVSAQSRNLGLLSRDIASAIKTLSQ
jgi:uncharacterized lipoprotein YmbA